MTFLPNSHQRCLKNPTTRHGDPSQRRLHLNPRLRAAMIRDFTTDPNHRPSPISPEGEAQVLIVDADEPFRSELETQFRRAGIPSVSTSDTDEALALLDRHCFALLVTETHINGYPALYMAEQSQRISPGLPILLITSSPSIDAAQRAFDLPAIKYLTKPADFEELVEHVRRALATTPRRIAVPRVIEQLSKSIEELQSTLTCERSSRTSEAHSDILFRLAIRRLIGSMHTLAQFVEPQHKGKWLCESIQCPGWQKHRAVFEDVLEVLRETKRRFKSKQLASLRDRVLQHIRQ